MNAQKDSSAHAFWAAVFVLLAIAVIVFFFARAAS
jgi:hypothetical protein